MKNKNDRPEQTTGLSGDSTIPLGSVQTGHQLRRLAEEIASTNVARLPEETPQTHELRVHQIELEMQNDELRRTQMELDILRARYFDLYDLAPVGYCSISEKGLILESNLTAANLLGVARGVLVNQLFSHFIFKEDQDIYYRHSKQIFEMNSTQSFELRMLKTDGTMFWANLQVVVAKYLDEAPVCRVMISDITERKQSEEALLNSRTAALNIIEDAYESRRKIEQVNMVLKEREEILKKNQENLQKLNRTLKALSRSDKTMMHATDESRYVNDVCKIVAEDCGYPMVWIGLAEEDEQKTVRPVAYAGFEDGYLETLKISWADTELGRGPTGTAIRTGKICKCGNMLTDPSFEPWRKEAVKRGYSSSIVFPLISMTGEKKTFGAMSLYSFEPDSFSDDEVNLLSELAEDLSHGIMGLRFRKLADEIFRRDKETLEKLVGERSEKLIDVQIELEKAKRLSDIGTLAATVAHELRNPLAAMSMALAIIRRKPTEETVNRQSDNIEKMINESNQIINNLLFYSRLRSPQYEVCDLHAILRECVEIQKRRSEKEILFNTCFDSEKSMMMADTLQMREVFNNLLNNAADAVPASGGQIGIQSHDLGNNVEIIIGDNGHGITGQILGKIFDPFFTTKAKGTGLGLTVCSQIVNMHDGKIDIISEQDKGSTVTLVLPKRKDSHE